MRNITYINAGAGSGKTYTLTDILAKKLSNAQKPIQPSQVILTTFTELAAAEFREKSRQAMLSSGNVEAASQIDSAAIGTVHSVALDFIRKFWYLLPYGSDVQIITDNNAQFYMSQSLERIAQEYQEEQRIFAQFRSHYHKVDQYGHAVDRFWEQILKKVVEKMNYYHVDDVEESIQRSIQQVEAIYTAPEYTEKDIASLREYLEAYLKLCKEDTTKAAKDQVAAIEPILKKPITGPYDLLSMLSKAPVGGKTTIEQRCPGYGRFIQAIQDMLLSRTELNILKPYIQAIFRLAKVWRDDFVAYKQSKRLITYDDMESLFLHLLEDEEEVQDYVRTHYRLVMVDEFQDSNPVQLKIFNKLSELVAEAGGCSYWVGDPKQAIYGFRGSDTDLIQSVASKFGLGATEDTPAEVAAQGLQTQCLTNSYRSRAVLVRLVNRVFEEAFQADHIEKRLITLEPIFEKDDLSTPAVGRWQLDKGNDYNAIALRVKQMLDRADAYPVHPDKLDKGKASIRPKDIAILCRTNRHCMDMSAALRSMGVPVSVVEKDIKDRVEVQLVVTLLHFLQDAWDKHTIADLSRLLFGEDTTTILKDRIAYLRTKPEVDEWRKNDERLIRLQQTLQPFAHLSVPEMLQAIIYELNLPALCAKWGEADIRRQNLATLQQLTQDYDQMCLQMGTATSINGFISYLNSVTVEPATDNQSDTVKVLTYHKSKGLEWSFVLLYDLNDESLKDNDFAKLNFMDVKEVERPDVSHSAGDPFTKNYYLQYFPNILPTPNNNVPACMLDRIIQQALFQQLKASATGEARRVLYVGMTRAKDYLYTYSSGKKSFAYHWLEDANIPQDFLATDAESLAVPTEDDIPAAPTTYTMVQKPETHQERPARYLSPSKIGQYAGYNAHREWPEHGAPITTQGWGNDYARIGTCIHDLFAVYRHGDDAFNRQAACSVISGHGLSSQLSGHIEAILAAARWLHDTLQQKYPQLHPSGLQREHPFIQTLPNGQTLRGEMDLVWQYTAADGTPHAILVDYKTFPGVDLNAHTPQYYAQLSAYASALADEGIQVDAALIYYPVHGTIHELTR
jgi:ATP-dependent exoDNAse (exonuclease V) beta subunit